MDIKTLFEQLVSIDSPSGEEATLSRFIVAYLVQLGGKPFVDKNNMIYCRFGEGAPQLFCSHLDTVEPGRSIRLVETEGYFRSAGDTILGADNKVSVAAILVALTESIKAGKTPNVELLFTVEEETVSGVSRFDVSRIQSRIGYVFDVGNGDLSAIVQSAPFIFDFAISATGKAAHASYPHLGKNALVAMTSLLSQLSLGRVDEWSTFNVGLITGGTATNSVPDHVICRGDIRSTRKNLFEEHCQKVESCAQQIAAQTGCRIEVEWIPYAFGYQLEFNTPAYHRIEHIYKTNGLPLTAWNTTSGSDAGFLNSVGIETYCLGDGVEEAHTVNERISIEKFEKLVHQIRLLMANT